jgi:hypothetical protein
MSNTIYCTYLTIYSGNKLPTFYIGSTSVEKIEQGYRGSVSSKRYQSIWEKELKFNSNLFKTRIITRHNTREEALEKEKYFQKSLNVVKSPMYINCAYAQLNGYAGMDVSGELNPMFGKTHSEETKKLITEKSIGKILSSETKKKISISNKGRKLSEKCCLEKSIRMRGENNHMFGKPLSVERKVAISERNRKRKGEKRNPLSTEQKVQIARNKRSKLQKFCFIHESGLIELDITRPDLRDKYPDHKLHIGNLSSVCSKKVTHYKGWSLLITDENQSSS